MQDRKWAVDLLRRAGYRQAAEEAEHELPEQVTLDEIKAFADRHGVSHDDIIIQMGGSP